MACVTLRRMTGRGWRAAESLTALLEDRKARGLPWTHDWLAAQTGIDRPAITMYCSGARRLGVQNGAKIADVLGVTLADLGGPAEGDVPRSMAVDDRLARLEEVAVTVKDLGPLLRVVRLLAAGKRAEAQRVLSEEGLPG